MSSFACTLKEKPKGFARYRYNFNHTSNTYDQAINLLSEGTIIKIQDFGKLYLFLTKWNNTNSLDSGAGNSLQ